MAKPVIGTRYPAPANFVIGPTRLNPVKKDADQNQYKCCVIIRQCVHHPLGFKPVVQTLADHTDDAAADKKP